MARVLAPFPRPVWHLPACVLACVRLLLDRDGRDLDGPLHDATASTRTLSALLRLRWSVCYNAQAELLLNVQSRRLTRGWARRTVRCVGNLPAGGAILIAPHHLAAQLGLLRLAATDGPIGGLTLWASDAVVPLPTAFDRSYYHAHQIVSQRIYGPRRFHVRHAGRNALRFLQSGGYLAIAMDGWSPTAPVCNLFGRAVRLPRGPVWLAQRSGKPLIPYMVVARRGHWEIQLGDPIPATRAAVTVALEACVRRSPGSWHRQVARMWLDAPPWEGE